MRTLDVGFDLHDLRFMTLANAALLGEALLHRRSLGRLFLLDRVVLVDRLGEFEFLDPGFGLDHRDPVRLVLVEGHPAVAEKLLRIGRPPNRPVPVDAGRLDVEIQLLAGGDDAAFLPRLEIEVGDLDLEIGLLQVTGHGRPTDREGLFRRDHGALRGLDLVLPVLDLVDQLVVGESQNDVALPDEGSLTDHFGDDRTRLEEVPDLDLTSRHEFAARWNHDLEVAPSDRMHVRGVDHLGRRGAITERQGEDHPEDRDGEHADHPESGLPGSMREHCGIRTR